jgi:hypothetical protein
MNEYQREYRNYRKRRYYRRRRYEQNMQHAKAFLMDFVKEELVHHIVPESLLEVLKEQKEQALQKMVMSMSQYFFKITKLVLSYPRHLRYLLIFLYCLHTLHLNLIQEQYPNMKPCSSFQKLLMMPCVNHYIIVLLKLYR